MKPALTPSAIDSALGHLFTVLGDRTGAQRHFDIAQELLEPFGATYAMVTDVLGRARLHTAIVGDDDIRQASVLAADRSVCKSVHTTARLAPVPPLAFSPPAGRA